MHRLNLEGQMRGSSRTAFARPRRNCLRIDGLCREISLKPSFCRGRPASEGQDPLGLNLRVSARLASQLFYCITSITPRARYYSFLPWVISLAPQLGLGRPLRERVRLIEKAFTAACFLHHDGRACDYGRLVGSAGRGRPTWRRRSRLRRAPRGGG